MTDLRKKNFFFQDLENTCLLQPVLTLHLAFKVERSRDERSKYRKS